MALLEIQNLEKYYPLPDGGSVKVLDVQEFKMKPGDKVVIHGESGSGKTTFLHLIAGILRADSGSVKLGGKELLIMSQSERDRLRATSIGYIFQTFNLLQGFTCLENVLLGMSFGPGIDEGRARSLLFKVGLENRLSHYPRQLSVGQQQRVALARALANRPKLVLADEPTGNLDPANSRSAVELLQELCDADGTGLLVVSHDMKVMDSFSEKVSWARLNRVIREVKS
ncbi:MAG: ABC transporter ATP-binding protein [Opitutales bacterium]|nr:ABC transporter ATP-binding protein [Opitutales bacterium]